MFTEEPPKYWTLIEHPNVVATPHLGASTVEAQLKVAQEIAQSFVDARAGKPLFGIVSVCVCVYCGNVCVCVCTVVMCVCVCTVVSVCVCVYCGKCVGVGVVSLWVCGCG